MLGTVETAKYQPGSIPECFANTPAYGACAWTKAGIATDTGGPNPMKVSGFCD